MPDAWDLIPTEERSADTTTTFILFCEDKVNEPAYFHSFQRDKKVKINFVEDQKSDYANYLNTIDYCLNEGLMQPIAGGYQLTTGLTQHIWCIYDRDAEVENKAALSPIYQIKFSTAIQTAQAAGLKVAWSNDVFELWILLHFEDVTPGQWQHRRYIYDRLTVIFQSLPMQSPEMQLVTSNLHFDYKEAMKKKQNFIAFVRPLLPSRQEIAIQRALALEAAFLGNIPYHDRNPCTKIYELVRCIESFY